MINILYYMKNGRILIYVLLLSLFISTSCSDESEVQIETGVGVVYGTILDSQNNEPLQGATVKIYPGGKSVVTGHDGQYEFTGLRNGGYIVQYSKQGYLSSVSSPVISSGNSKSQNDISLDTGEPCLELFLGELDFGNNLSAKTFVVSNKGNKTISWSLYSDYNSFLSFDNKGGVLAPSESVAVNVNLLRTGTSAEITSFPIYIQANGEKLGAIATVSLYNDVSLNSLIVGTWTLVQQEFWEYSLNQFTYNTYDTENGVWLTFGANYEYKIYERQFMYNQDISNQDHMFSYQHLSGKFSYDIANGIVQLGEYGTVYSINKLSKDYLELHEIPLKDKDKGSTILFKRVQ